MLKRQAEHFFEWFCHPEYHRDILGDLEELYRDRLEFQSKFRAEMYFVRQVLLCLRLSLIKPIRLLKFIKHPIMFAHYLKTAWRYSTKNPFQSLINIFGLVVGMTASLIIWKYVSYERSYDGFHENSDRIYRVRTDRMRDGEPFMQFAAGTACAGPLLADNFPQIESYVKLRGTGEAIYTYNNESPYKLESAYYAMPSLFEIFSFELISGNPETCLSEPFTACITQSLAAKFFGEEDPIGKTLTRNGTDTYKITGVIADPLPNSHLKFELLLSYITFSDVFNEGGSTETSATWDGFYTYLLLRPHIDGKDLESRFPEAIEKTFNVEMRENLVFRLQALKDIHLDSHYLFESEANGDRLAVRLLSIIGIIILVIAWFNFINVSTARATHRAKEVGIKKVIGGSRKKLVSQFLLEAVMFNAIAIGISLLLIPLLQGPFEALVGKPISLSPFSYPTFYFISLLVLIIGTLLSGLYPAFVLSSIRPIQALKSNVGQFSYRGGNWLRKSLLLVQYIASASLIACTLLIYFQLQYLQKTKLGINLDQVLIVEGPIVRDSTSFTKYQTFARDVEELAYVNNIVGSSSIPGQGFGWTIGTVRRVGGPEEITRSFHALVADEEYTRMYEMELAAGRHLMGDMGTEELSCILNETGVRKLEFASPQKAIGEKVELKNGNQLTIVGVLKDFYQESPKSAIEPLLLVKPWGQMIPQYFSIKLQTQNLPETLQKLETKWVNFFPQTPFQYFFLDDHFNKQYEADRRFAQAFTLFSGLTIFVSCLGIFALIAFTVERKRKEIGIRRILGASVGRIILLLSSDLFRLIGLALIISLPIAWYVMDKWLETFIHHISIQWWVFLIAGLLTLIITLFTSGFHSLKAAMTNPVESLRNE